MTNEDYVSFEIAKLLEEKGFKEDITRVVNEEGEIDYLGSWQPGLAHLHHTWYRCPTIQMAMKWLREVHNIHIEVNLSFSEDPIKYPPFYYVYVLDSKSGNSVIDQAARIDGLNPLVDVNNVPRNFNTYEEACEAAIKYCLEKLIQL